MLLDSSSLSSARLLAFNPLTSSGQVGVWSLIAFGTQSGLKGPRVVAQRTPLDARSVREDGFRGAVTSKGGQVGSVA